MKHRFSKYTFRFVRYIYSQWTIFCLQNVFKTSSRYVFKTPSRHVSKTSWRRLQRNNFSFSKTSWKMRNCYAEGVTRRRDALFWIHLRQTWLNSFGLNLATLSFSTFIFSIGIKLFIRHPVALFDTLILLEQVDGFAQLPPWCILKDRQLYLQKYLKY